MFEVGLETRSISRHHSLSAFSLEPPVSKLLPPLTSAYLVSLVPPVSRGLVRIRLVQLSGDGVRLEAASGRKSAALTVFFDQLFRE